MNTRTYEAIILLHNGPTKVTVQAIAGAQAKALLEAQYGSDVKISGLRPL